MGTRNVFFKGFGFHILTVLFFCILQYTTIWFHLLKANFSKKMAKKEKKKSAEEKEENKMVKLAVVFPKASARYFTVITLITEELYGVHYKGCLNFNPAR